MTIPEEILRRLREKDPALTRLNLTRHDPDLTDVDMGYLAVALKDNKILKSLILSENAIGNEGAKILAQALSTTNVTTLDLSLNKISDTGAKALFEISSLRHLILGGNSIGNLGVTNIRDNNTLRILIIDGNDINDDGIQAFLHNTSLTELVFDDDKVNSGLVTQIKEHTQNNIRGVVREFLLRALEPVGLLSAEARDSFAQELHQAIDAKLRERPSVTSTPFFDSRISVPGHPQ